MAEVTFHCKCEKCGKLIHVKCHELDAIRGHLMEDHDFLMDYTKTIIYGICAQCRGVI